MTQIIAGTKTEFWIDPAILALLPTQGCVELQRDAAGKVHAFHTHPVDEILMIIKGALKFEWDGGELSSALATPFYLPAGTRHQSEALNEAIYAIAMLPPAVNPAATDATERLCGKKDEGLLGTMRGSLPGSLLRCRIDFRAKPSRLPGYAIPVPHLRCEMKDPTYVAELQKRLGAPSSETVESLRLLKAFLKLAPGQRFEIIELVERLATDACRQRSLIVLKTSRLSA